MNNICMLCGTELNESGLCPNTHSFKKMCVNCVYCNDEMRCTNEVNMQTIVDKMKAVAGESYNVDEIKLTPTVLKCLNKKCKNWELNPNVLTHIATLFN